MFNWNRRKKPVQQHHSKILEQSLECGSQFVLINTVFMEHKYTSPIVEVHKGSMEWTYWEDAIVSFYQSVCPHNRHNGFIKVTDFANGKFRLGFTDADYIEKFIIEHEEPYKAREIIRELFGREIPLY